MNRAKNIDLLGARHVIANMRASDWLEVSNLVPRALCEVDALAMYVTQYTRLGFMVERDGIPAAIVQAAEKHNGCWSVGMFATDDFPLIWRTVMKHIRHVLMPSLIDLGARYCEAHVHADNLPAQRFLEALGFRARSSVLESYGAFGEPFILYAITIEDLPDVLRQSSPAAATR